MLDTTSMVIIVVVLVLLYVLVSLMDYPVPGKDAVKRAVDSVYGSRSGAGYY